LAFTIKYISKRSNFQVFFKYLFFWLSTPSHSHPHLPPKQRKPDKKNAGKRRDGGSKRLAPGQAQEEGKRQVETPHRNPVEKKEGTGAKRQMSTIVYCKNRISQQLLTLQSF
jgi:hypothetical protein